jgi:hypothetical protein
MRRRQISARLRRSEVHKARCLKYRAHFCFALDNQTNGQVASRLMRGTDRRASWQSSSQVRSGQDDRWAAEARARRSFDALLESRSA